MKKHFIKIIFIFVSAFFFRGILSTQSNVSNFDDQARINASDHGCMPTYNGYNCNATVLTLEGEGLSFLKQIQGYFDKIEEIRISGNEEASTIPSSLFLPFFNLKILKVHNSNVIDIETGAFRSLHKLELLEISGNSLLTFDSVTRGLAQLNSPNLQVFNISGSHNAEDLNPGAIIESTMFEYLSNTSLKSLDVSWTRLFTLSASFDLLPHVETFNISGTYLLASPNCISTLVTSNISYLAMDHWLKFSRGYSSIRLLDEPKGLFKRDTNSDCKPKTYLSERGCLKIRQQFRTIQARFTDLDSLFVDFSNLCFEENNILNHVVSNSKISKPLHIMGYGNLKLFDMSYTEVFFEGPLIKPDFFYSMPSLKVLRIAGFHLYRLNDIQIENLVSRNYNLSELDISYNQLTDIPRNMFKDNKYLVYLNISRNKLTVFETDLSSCIHLVSLDLSDNNLKMIDVNVNTFIMSLARNFDMNLKKNELDCSCNLLSIAKYRNISIPPFTCRYHGENRLISKNVSQEFNKNVCEEEQINNDMMTFLGVALAAIVMAVIIIVAIVCYRKRKSSAKKRSKANVPFVINLKDCNHIVEQPPRNPKFILFLAYSSKDSEFVVKKIYKELNRKLFHLLKDTDYANDPDNVIIIYDKHFLAGIDIDEICRVAIIESHVTVAVVTENFLQSAWCDLEVKMALSSKVPLIPLFITKCEPDRLTGFLRVVYEEKVRLLWPDTSGLDETQAKAEESILLDTLCSHIISYVQLHQNKTLNETAF